MSKPKPKDKSFAIPKQLVWEAYRRVAANKGAPGWMGRRWRSSRLILGTTSTRSGIGVRPERVFDLPVGVRPR